MPGSKVDTPAAAVIGAGMAGLAAARLLRASGVACTVFDKSRGVGGRMATRRAGPLEFDHGAQFFTARGPRFAGMVEDWRAGGTAAEWFDGAFVGAPRITAVARAMAASHTVVTDSHVTSLRRDSGGWTVHDADGPVRTDLNGRFDAVVIAVPAPQALPLAGSAGVVFEALDRVAYAPCWTLMLAFDHALDLPAAPLRPLGAPAALISRNSGKPGRDPKAETVVVQAGPEWSRSNLERPAEAVALDLTAAFAEVTGVTAVPVFSAAHRWRYALVEATAGQPCLWNAAERVGACGDWALGPRVECAFDSGEAVARAVLDSLEVEHVIAGA